MIKFLFIAGLLVLIVILIYRLDLYRSYNKYRSDKIEKLETDLKKEQDLNNNTLK